ncbi:MAG TPA: virion core protein (lumpy skin disease virus), partial [Ruminococcaceae bacterium]|nr:virion core protein (lumpy skin disease virus) [Oscillospiraceae bacterium]
NKGITGKFCPECGTKRPEKPSTWDCACGNKGITGKFCPECGKKRSD